MKDETVDQQPSSDALSAPDMTFAAEHRDLTDVEWARVEPLLTRFYAGTDNRGRPTANRRATLNGVLWKLFHDRPWADLPPRFPNAKTCNRYFKVWFRSGLLGNLLLELSSNHLRLMHAAANSVRRRQFRRHSNAAEGTKKSDPEYSNPLTASEIRTCTCTDEIDLSTDDRRQSFIRSDMLSLDRAIFQLSNEINHGQTGDSLQACISSTQVDGATNVAITAAKAGSVVDQYLNDPLLLQLPPSVLKFLLNTSLPERLSPAACEAVRVRQDEFRSKPDWLERHNVRVRQVDKRQSYYCYQAVLSDALRHRLACQWSPKVHALHHCVSRSHTGDSLWPDAIQHTLTADELQLATHWIQNCATEMLERGDPHRLLAWIGRLPSAILGGLRVRLVKAWALAVSLQLTLATTEISFIAVEIDQARREDCKSIANSTLAEVNAVSALIAAMCDDSERALELARAVHASREPVAPIVKCYAQSMQIFGLTYRGKFDEIFRIWKIAEDQMNTRPEPTYSHMVAYGMFGLAALIHGAFPEARRTLELGLQHAESTLGHSSACAAGIAGCLASIYYECNELALARKTIAGRTAIALETSSVSALMRHTFSASRLLWRNGETSSALAVLEDSRQVAITRQWSRLKSACDAETVKVLVESGHMIQARKIADGLSVSEPAMHEGWPGSAVETWAIHSILQARVLIAENLAGKAIPILARSLDTVTSMGWHYLEAQISLLLSIAFERCDAHEKALAELRHALSVGEKIGMVNSFVDEGPAVRELLQRFRRHSEHTSSDETAYVDRLLLAFDNVSTAAPPLLSLKALNAAPSVLSTRELEVIHHVARGLSNKEISRLMSLAPETIKWHLKNIFKKLSVRSRIEAVLSVHGPKD